MQTFPHHYHVSASGSVSTNYQIVKTKGRVDLTMGAPIEFGGTGEHWSPEEILLAAIADCYILSFIAIAKISQLPWQNISCQVEGILDKIERTTQFVSFSLIVDLDLTDKLQQEKANKLLTKAKEICLVTNSLKAPTKLIINSI